MISPDSEEYTLACTPVGVATLVEGGVVTVPVDVEADGCGTRAVAGKINGNDLIGVRRRGCQVCIVVAHPCCSFDNSTVTAYLDSSTRRLRVDST